MSTTPTPSSQGLRLRLAWIAPSPTNPRKTFEPRALEELSASIKEHGVLQPVLVRPWPPERKRAKGHEDGPLFELVAGERRVRASHAAGLEEVPALVRELSDEQVIDIQLVENIQRKDLHALEEADGYRQLMRVAKYDAARIAAKIGMSAKYVYDRIKLLELIEPLKKAFLADRFTVGHAIILARLSKEDQKRALEEHGALFTGQGYLALTPEEEEAQDLELEKAEERGTADDMIDTKPVSVRELQAWAQRHTAIEPAQVDPMLFPETAEVLEAAAQAEEKVLRVTHLTITPHELRGQDGPKVILGASWKRADGAHGSKTCDHSKIGHVVIGPGQGQALRVCAAKEKCEVHWGERIRAKKKREREVEKAAKGRPQVDREALRRKKEAEAQAAQAAKRGAWKAATPEILEALAEALKKASTGAASAIGQLVLELSGTARRREPGMLLGEGRSAEDLVRFIAYAHLADQVEWSQNYGDAEEITKDLRALGVDVKKILAAKAPPAPPKASSSTTKGKAGRPTRAKKAA